MSELSKRIAEPVATGDEVVIWSGEHNAYWNPDGRGYTRPGRYEGVWTAGVYTREQAEKWTSGCGPEKEIELVPLADALALREIDPKTVIARMTEPGDSLAAGEAASTHQSPEDAR